MCIYLYVISITIMWLGQFRSGPREPILYILMDYYVLLYMYKKHPLYEIAFRDSMSLESLSEVSDLL